MVLLQSFSGFRVPLGSQLLRALEMLYWIRPASTEGSLCCGYLRESEKLGCSNVPQI